MLVFATPIVSLALFGKDWTSIAGAVVLGIIAAILAARLVRAFIKVNCPICGSNDIRENYYGGRGSDDVTHTCNACGRQYDCGVLRD
jgi:hypothetical protein